MGDAVVMNTEGRIARRTWDSIAIRQAEDLRTLFGARAIAVDGLVYIAREDWAKTRARAIAHRLGQPVSWGFWLGGNDNLVIAPAWTLDLDTVKKARRHAWWRIIRREIASITRKVEKA